MSIYEFGSDASGLHFTITTSVNEKTGLTDFVVNVLTGSMNFNAIYWSNGIAGDQDSSKDEGFTGAKSENSLNMNGSNVVWNDDGTSHTVSESYDGGMKFSDAGLGKTPPATYLHAGENYCFSADVDLSVFSTIGVRATSTSTAEGSIKWVDDNPYTPPPVEEVLSYDGLSQGAWGTIRTDKAGNPILDADGNPIPIGAGDWSQTNYLPDDSFEAAFGDLGAPLNTPLASDMSLFDVLKAPVQGSADLALGKQAVGALLNADSSGEDSLTQSYRFSVDEIKAAMQEAYDGDQYDAAQKADLQDLFAFWNTAPEANHTTDIDHVAAVDGELHSDDTTTIATTLLYDGHNGGSFTGSIFEVLAGIDGNQDNGWLL